MSCLNVDPIGLVDRAIRQSALTHGIQGRLLLAISGGLDSMVLLDALARARDLGVIPRLTLHAVHVHHGLSENADDWMSHVRRECQKRDVSFQGCRVTLQKNAQESLEELARHARYNAFAEVLTQSSSHLLVLAHHMDDQAETLLLQLLRGAGPRGLSGMAEYPSSPTKLCIWRPLISVSRKDLLNYSNARNISFVHDESNEHLHFKRNFLRHRVFPVIEEAFPAYRKTFARAALLQAQATSMIEELVNHEARFPLSLDVFRASSDEKARALLRGALKHLGLRSPSLARLTEMARQFKYARDDGRVSLKVSEDRSLGIHRGHIYCYQHISSYSVKWRGEKEILLPHGVLRCLDNQACRGVRVDLDSDTVEITCRKSPNETLKRANRPQRTLGDLLREAGVPHWARDAYPRVYQNDRLVCVPSRGVDECAHAHPKGQYVDFIFEPNEVSQGSVERALTTQTNKSRRR